MLRQTPVLSAERNGQPGSSDPLQTRAGFPSCTWLTNKYLEQIEALKKPNTHPEVPRLCLIGSSIALRDRNSIDAISADDLTGFVVSLKKIAARQGSNTILPRRRDHGAISASARREDGVTRELPLPKRITPLVKVYRHEELAHFFAACSDAERALFATFLLSGFP